MTAKRILIVDDDRETCRLIAELVGGPGRMLVDAWMRPRTNQERSASVIVHVRSATASRSYPPPT